MVLLNSLSWALEKPWHFFYTVSKKGRICGISKILASEIAKSPREPKDKAVNCCEGFFSENSDYQKKYSPTQGSEIGHTGILTKSSTRS